MRGFSHFVTYPTLDDLHIGPFPSWDAANDFAQKSVFLKQGHHFKINTMNYPRPDHTNGEYRIELPEIK